MKVIKKMVAMFLVAVTIVMAIPSTDCMMVIVAEAHSGRTDANGGHKDNKNVSGLGAYHYHCGD